MNISRTRISGSHFRLVVLFLLTAFFVSVLYPWSDGFGNGYFAHHRISQVSLLISVFFCLFFLFPLVGKAQEGIYSLSAAASLFYLVGLLSVLRAEHLLNALFHYVHWIMLGGLFVACAAVRDSRYIGWLLFIVFILQGALVFLSMLYLLFALANGDPLNADIIYPISENIRFFNQVQVFVVALILAYMRHQRFNVILSILLFFNMLLLFIGGARGASLTVIFLAVGVSIIPKYRLAAVASALVMLAAAVLYILILIADVGGVRELGRVTSSGRLDMWHEVVILLELHGCIWGVGPGNYPAYTVFNFGHPHNSIIQILFEWGGLALIGAGLFFCKVIFESARYLRVNNYPEQVFALFLACLGALLYSLVDGVLVMPIAQSMFFIFLGLLSGVVENNMAEEKPYLVVKVVGCAVSMFLLLVYLVLTVSSYNNQLKMQDAKGPRFWINGEVLETLN